MAALDADGHCGCCRVRTFVGSSLFCLLSISRCPLLSIVEAWSRRIWRGRKKKKEGCSRNAGWGLTDFRDLWFQCPGVGICHGFYQPCIIAARHREPLNLTIALAKVNPLNKHLISTFGHKYDMTLGILCSLGYHPRFLYWILENKNLCSKVRASCTQKMLCCAVRCVPRCLSALAPNVGTYIQKSTPSSTIPNASKCNR